MMTFRSATLACTMLFAAAIPGPARTEPVQLQRTMANGIYHCEVYALGMFIHLGDIIIDGPTYRGPAWFEPFAGPYRYEVTPYDEINWLGPLGGFTSGGNSIDLTQVTVNTDKKASFDIIMREASGNFSATTCEKR